MELDIAMAKLREYTICGLAHNIRDTSQADEWLEIVKGAIAEKPCNKEIAEEALNRIMAYCSTGWPQKDIGDIAKNALHAMSRKQPHTQTHVDKEPCDELLHRKYKVNYGDPFCRRCGQALSQ